MNNDATIGIFVSASTLEGAQEAYDKAVAKLNALKNSETVERSLTDIPIQNNFQSMPIKDVEKALPFNIGNTLCENMIELARRNGFILTSDMTFFQVRMTLMLLYPEMLKLKTYGEIMSFVKDKLSLKQEGSRLQNNYYYSADGKRWDYRDLSNMLIIEAFLSIEKMHGNGKDIYDLCVAIDSALSLMYSQWLNDEELAMSKGIITIKNITRLAREKYIRESSKSDDK